MLYHALEWTQSALAPARAGAQLTRMALRTPWNPWSDTVLGRWLDAGCQTFESLTRRYERPAWGLTQTTIRGRTVAVEEQTLAVDPFCTLRRFRRVGVAQGDPRLLIVAPLSGHFATLLRDTVRTLLPDHDVYVTDWADARDVSPAAGRFDFEDYVDHVIRYLRRLGPGAHVLAVCQPAVPVLAAVSVMATLDDPAAPASMTLVGGPIDSRRSPTAPNDLAQQHPLRWFERRLTTTVPAPYVGAGRKVYPGFLQLSGFISMNLRLHVDSHWQFFENLVRNDGEGSEAHRRFYDEYLAVMDLTAEFYLDTIRKVFQEHRLPRGTLTHRGLPVRPQDITRTALLTVEGANDDISGPGQTVAAQSLCSGLRRDQKRIYVHPSVGHYGTFSGRRWREDIAPQLRDFIRLHNGPQPGPSPAPGTPTPEKSATAAAPGIVPAAGQRRPRSKAATQVPGAGSLPVETPPSEPLATRTKAPTSPRSGGRKASAKPVESVTAGKASGMPARMPARPVASVPAPAAAKGRKTGRRAASQGVPRRRTER